jgi:O-antigen/teichoic acid export membrane protein
MVNKVAKDNVIYAVGSVANSAALILLVPYLVNTLTPTEFGIWSLLEIGILIVSLLISAGMDIGLMRQYWFLEDALARARLAGTVIIAVAAWGLILTAALMGLVLHFGAAQLVGTTPRIAMLALLSAFFEAIFGLALNLFRIREEPTKFVVLSIGRLLLFLTGSIALVAAGRGLTGAIAGRAFADMIALVAGLIVTRQYYVFYFDRARLKRVITYGLPLLPTNLAAYILLASDRFFLQFFTSAAIVGIYSFAYKIVSIFDVLVNRPFALDWAPRRFKIATFSDAPQRYANVLIAYLFVATLSILIIIAVAPFLYELLAPPVYLEGLKVLPILLLAALVYGLSYPLNVGIVIKDKTVYAAIIGIVAALLCIVFNFWLIPPYGMLGAAWATLLAYGVWTGGMTIVSLHLYPVPYPGKKLLTICATALLGYAGLYWSMQVNGISSLLMLVTRLGWLATVFGITALIFMRRLRRTNSIQL